MAPANATLAASQMNVGEIITPTRDIPVSRSQSSRPTDFEMASAVVLESGCTQEDADGLIKFLHKAVAGADSDGIYRIPRAELAAHHQLFSTVCPDEYRARTGSAHATIERGLGTTILHTRTQDNCAIAVGVGL